MKPTPQASCSLAGSYRPCFWGRSIFDSSNDTQDHVLGVGRNRPKGRRRQTERAQKAGRARTGFVVCTNLVQKQRFHRVEGRPFQASCTILDTTVLFAAVEKLYPPKLAGFNSFFALRHATKTPAGRPLRDPAVAPRSRMAPRRSACPWERRESRFGEPDVQRANERRGGSHAWIATRVAPTKTTAHPAAVTDARHGARLARGSDASRDSADPTRRAVRRLHRACRKPPSQ